MAKKTVFILFVMLFSVVSLEAQRVHVIDSEGQPVPFVTATTPEGKYIASTDIDGWLENLDGHTTITLSQVAYKTMTIAVADIKNNTVMLEEATYDLPEVVVTPKPLVYARTYFRLIYINDNGPIYYRGGVIDNTYNIDKKKVDAKMRHISKAEFGLIRFVVDRLAGKFDRFSRLPEMSYYQKLTQMKDQGLVTFTDAGNGRIIVSDDVSVVGYIDWNEQERIRTVSFDMFKYDKHQKNARERVKAEKKGKAFEADTTLTINGTIYQVYRTDSVGNSRVEDFVMSQYTQLGHHKRQNADYVIQLQSFATDYAYVDKKEFKIIFFFFGGFCVLKNQTKSHECGHR